MNEIIEYRGLKVTEQTARVLDFIKNRADSFQAATEDPTSSKELRQAYQDGEILLRRLISDLYQTIYNGTLPKLEGK